MPRILVAESSGFSEAACGLLSRLGTVVLADCDRGDLRAALRDADVLWVRLRHAIDADLLAAAPRLKAIATPTTGLGHIDLEEAARRGIRVLSLRGATEFLENVRATAEHTVALVLALLRRLPLAEAHVRAGGWNRELFKGNELYGKTVGIVGYGRLGRIVARYFRAFETSVLAADPNVRRNAAEPGVTLAPLEELLPQSDIVTLHVNLSKETRSLFGPARFAAMKDGAWFVNTARGELVDEAALLESLHSGRLAGAALDVLCHEYGPDLGHHPLVTYARQHDNLLITPHLGGCTVESMEKTEIFLAEKLCLVWSSLLHRDDPV